MIFKINAQVGDDFNVFFKELVRLCEKITRQHYVSWRHFSISPSQFWDGLDIKEQKALADMLKEEINIVYDKNASWKEKADFADIAGKYIYDSLLKSLRKNPIFELHSMFNNRRYVVKGNTETGENTSFKDILAQKKKYEEKEEREYQEWLSTDEGKTYIKEQKDEEKFRNKKKKEYKQKLKAISFSFCEGGEEKWKRGLENNKDSYGRGVYDYALYWAYLMEQEMNDELTEQVKSRTSHVADVEGISGFMYGGAVKILTHCWKYGEQLRLLHNFKVPFDTSE